MLPLVIMGVGAALGAAGSIYAGVAADRQARSEADLYRTQAAARLQKAEFDAAQAQRKFVRNQGTVITRAASTGIDLQDFADVLADDAMESALEKAAIRWSAQSEAKMLEYQASAAIQRGKDAKTASYFRAAGSVVNAFSPLASRRADSSAAPSGVSVSDNSPGYLK
jgi:hypothetical protein